MTREQLIASLTTATDNRGYYVDDDRYFDWSTTNADGTTRFEVGDGAANVQLDLSREEIAGLQQQLTLWLLADAA